MLRELDAYLARVPALAQRPVCQIHLGGGTPTFLPPDQLAELIDGHLLAPDAGGRRARIGRGGSARDLARASRHAACARLHAALARDPGLQRRDAAARQPHPVAGARRATCVRHARESGYESINFDLIYGLPAQTPESMRETAERGARARAGSARRLQLRARAVDQAAAAQVHATIRFRPAPRSARCTRPSASRCSPAGTSSSASITSPSRTTALARAAASGTMHRNFQGYTERRTTALFGLGVSAISETPDCYHQNEKIITVYERRVQKGEVPTLRGHKLSDGRSRAARQDPRADDRLPRGARRRRARRRARVSRADDRRRARRDSRRRAAHPDARPPVPPQRRGALRRALAIARAGRAALFNLR